MEITSLGCVGGLPAIICWGVLADRGSPPGKFVFGQSGNFLGAVASNLITTECVNIERQRLADVRVGVCTTKARPG